MIRPFQLRDLALVHRLGEGGVVLQAETALTASSHPLRGALLHMLVGGQHSTYIWKSEDGDASAFVQLYWEDENSTARLACLGTDTNRDGDGEHLDLDESVWLNLLDQLVVEAGKRGVHSLIAEASETGDELPILRRAGFAIYARQDIWVSEDASSSEPSCQLIARESVDDWDVHVLYANVVPRLIQSVEPTPPLAGGKNWLLREDGELAAYVHVKGGPVASWMRLFIHPNARTQPEDIIQSAIHQIQPTQQQPLFFCIRRYQSWLQTPLEQAGFGHWGSQAVMVKHVARRVESPGPTLKPVLEPQTVPSSSPLVQRFGDENGNGRGLKK